MQHIEGFEVYEAKRISEGGTHCHCGVRFRGANRVCIPVFKVFQLARCDTAPAAVDLNIGEGIGVFNGINIF